MELRSIDRYSNSFIRFFGAEKFAVYFKPRLYFLTTKMVIIVGKDVNTYTFDL
jgi:hypothetical protein